MNFECLKRLNMACSSEERYYMDGLNLGELYWRSEKTGVQTHRFTAAMAALCDLCAPENEAMKEGMAEIDEVSGDLCCAYEEQGFINGFRFAVKMMKEAQA